MRQRQYSPEFERELIRQIAARRNSWPPTAWTSWAIGLTIVIGLGLLTWGWSLWFRHLDRSTPMRLLSLLDVLGLAGLLTGSFILRFTLHGHAQSQSANLMRCPLSTEALLRQRLQQFTLGVWLFYLWLGLAVGLTEWRLLGAPQVIPAYLLTAVGLSCVTVAISCWLAIPLARQASKGYWPTFIGYVIIVPVIQMRQWIITAPPIEMHKVFGYLPTSWVTNPIREWMWGWPVQTGLVMAVIFIGLSTVIASRLLLGRIRHDDLLILADPTAAPSMPTRSPQTDIAPIPDSRRLFDQPSLGWADRLLWRWFTVRESAIAEIYGLPRTNFSLFLALATLLVVIAGGVVLLYGRHPFHRTVFLCIGLMLTVVYGLREGRQIPMQKARRHCFAPVVFPVGIWEHIRMIAKLSVFRLSCGAIFGLVFLYQVEGSWQTAPRTMLLYWTVATGLVVNALNLDIVSCSNMGSLFRARGWFELPCLAVSNLLPFTLMGLMLSDRLDPYLSMITGGFALLSLFTMWLLVRSYQRSNVSFAPDGKMAFVVPNGQIH